MNEKRSYDSFSSSSFAHNGEIEFVDKATYNILKSAYGKVDFSGEFRTGDTAVYDLHKKEYVKLIKGEADFYDRKTGEKLSIGDLQHEVNFEESLLMLFDMSGDGNPELCITDGARYKYVFKYNPKSDRFILWADLGLTWYGLAGTQEVFWSRFQENNIFYILDENGNPNCTVYFHTKALMNDKTEQRESAYMVSMPEYAGETVKYTKAMKSKRYFDEYHQKYFFRVTREQYDQLVTSDSSLETSNWNPSPSFVNLYGSMSISPSEDMAEAKWFSLAISMPTLIMRLYLPFVPLPSEIYQYRFQYGYDHLTGDFCFINSHLIKIKDFD